eukprot:4425060-Pyramimonas_sp.AAC.1
MHRVVHDALRAEGNETNRPTRCRSRRYRVSRCTASYTMLSALRETKRIDRSDAGVAGIFSRRTNRTQERRRCQPVGDETNRPLRPY